MTEAPSAVSESRSAPVPAPATRGAVLSVGLNPALDTTYRLSDWSRGDAHRVGDVSVRAGGKAANVVRVALAAGHRAHLLAPLGGTGGHTYLEELRAADVPCTVVDTAVETRRSIAVVDDTGDATVFNEAGSPVAPAVLDAVVAALRRLIVDVPALVVTVNGSTPPGLPEGAAATLVLAAREHGVPVIADVSTGLGATVAAHPDVVKPNASELRDLVGATGLPGALALAARAPGTVVVASAGPDGLLCVVPPREALADRPLRAWADTDRSVWRAGPPHPVVGNPTGAGDALVAALAGAVCARSPLEAALREAVGLSAAAVAHPLAGAVDPALARRLAEGARVERVPL